MTTHYLNSDDSKLIKLFQQTQQHKYFELLYSRYAVKVYSKCLYLLENDELAKDVTQDIFIKVFLNIHSFEYRSSFMTWLYAITHNCCMDQLRINQRMSYSRLKEGFDIPFEDYLREDRLDRIIEIFESLPTLNKKLLRLQYEEGLDQTEIAKLLKIKVGAVKMRQFRSRRKILKLFLQSLDDE
ncbi:RNA polymerase sigma factor [Spirosoma panaciterrae]|uniref:RNA polymerase sigma factor n=1 Tax=Spirosoma panaciterrae TaxID=496058 RepID=UPI00036E5F3A|nr:RNA polymerase sigma factor [Spirosoma panaciterrae]